jgi:hypothetical protein
LCLNYLTKISRKWWSSVGFFPGTLDTTFPVKIFCTKKLITYLDDSPVPGIRVEISHITRATLSYKSHCLELAKNKRPNVKHDKVQKHRKNSLILKHLYRNSTDKLTNFLTHYSCTLHPSSVCYYYTSRAVKIGCAISSLLMRSVHSPHSSHHLHRARREEIFLTVIFIPPVTMSFLPTLRNQIFYLWANKGTQQRFLTDDSMYNKQIWLALFTNVGQRRLFA